MFIHLLNQTFIECLGWACYFPLAWTDCFVSSGPRTALHKQQFLVHNKCSVKDWLQFLNLFQFLNSLLHIIVAKFLTVLDLNVFTTSEYFLTYSDPSGCYSFCALAAPYLYFAKKKSNDVLFVYLHLF